MAVVVYQCDTCKREIYRQQNKHGLDVIGRCIITNGCSGTLNLQEVKPSYSIGHSTPSVVGLTDWTPRKVLYTQHQNFLKKTWEITHNLNNQPAVLVYVYSVPGDDSTLHKVDPESIVFTSNDTVVVTFATAVTGIVQCQARSASDGQNITSLLPSVEPLPDPSIFSINQSFRLTNGLENGELTLATRVGTVVTPGFAPTRSIELSLHFLSPTSLAEISVPITLSLRTVDNTPVDTLSSPWAGVTYATIKGQKYLLRSVNIHANGNLTDMGIPQGAPCYFSIGYLGNPKVLTDDEILVLTATSPFHTVDRQYSVIADLADITKDNASTLISYVDNDLLGNAALLEEIFPSIIPL